MALFDPSSYSGALYQRPAEQGIGDVYSASRAVDRHMGQTFSLRDYGDERIPEGIPTEERRVLLQAFEAYDVTGEIPEDRRYGNLEWRPTGPGPLRSPSDKIGLRRIDLRKIAEEYNRDVLRQRIEGNTEALTLPEILAQHGAESAGLLNIQTATESQASGVDRFIGSAGSGIVTWANELSTPLGASIFAANVATVGLTAPLAAARFGRWAALGIESAIDAGFAGVEEGVRVFSIADNLRRSGMSEEEVNEYQRNAIIGGVLGGAVATGILGSAALGLRSLMSRSGRILPEEEVVAWNQINSQNVEQKRAGFAYFTGSEQPEHIRTWAAGAVRAADDYLNAPKELRTQEGLNRIRSFEAAAKRALDTGDLNEIHALVDRGTFTPTGKPVDAPSVRAADNAPKDFAVNSNANVTADIAARSAAIKEAGEQVETPVKMNRAHVMDAASVRQGTEVAIPAKSLQKMRDRIEAIDLEETIKDRLRIAETQNDVMRAISDLPNPEINRILHGLGFKRVRDFSKLDNGDLDLSRIRVSTLDPSGIEHVEPTVPARWSRAEAEVRATSVGDPMDPETLVEIEEGIEADLRLIKQELAIKPDDEGAKTLNKMLDENLSGLRRTMKESDELDKVLKCLTSA